MSHVYVLALTSHESPPLTIDGHRIEFIMVENLFVAVERRSRPPATSEQALRSQHDLVTAIFNSVDDLLPVQFGTWIDREELTGIVARQKSAIVDALALVRDRVQMTVRLFTAAPEQDRLSRDRPQTGTEYLTARREAEQSIPDEGARLRDAVREIVVAERVSARSPRMPATLYHLIARNAVEEYMSATVPFQSATVTVSGPYPPFAFAPDRWL